MIPISMVYREQSFVDCCLCKVETSKDYHEIVLVVDSDNAKYEERYICDYCYKFIRGELK